MSDISNILDQNQRWAAARSAADPHFFSELAKGQSPKILWIGCADSRVPATDVTGLGPGEVFVHRNIANVVAHTDLNCLSVIQYAVEVLKVDHVVVCGHYGCGGVQAAAGDHAYGLIDSWLRHIKDVIASHQASLDALEPEARLDRMCELNVAAQVANVCATASIQSTWRSGRRLSVHGLIYALKDGHLKDLGLTVSSLEGIAKVFRMAP
jgi:carbonic anhydrase